MYQGAIVVMGVASCGKTTLGEALAARMGLAFTEGDLLHAPESVAKMSRGIPLTDEDRWPWLQRVGCALVGAQGALATCSALKHDYRRRIANEAGRPVTFIHLHGDAALLQKRIDQRRGHFMPPTLLQSQLAALEIPDRREQAVTIDIALTPQQQLDIAIAYLMDATAQQRRKMS